MQKYIFLHSPKIYFAKNVENPKIFFAQNVENPKIYFFKIVENPKIFSIFQTFCHTKPILYHTLFRNSVFFQSFLDMGEEGVARPRVFAVEGGLWGSLSTATNTGVLAVRDRSCLFGIAKRDTDMFTTTKSIYPTKLMENDAEAVVVVAVVGGVVVPIRNAAVPRVVVPAATADHAVGACCLCRKHHRRKPLV